MSSVEIPGAAQNPCISCGACCARFRVSFYWGEADDAPGGIVPAALTEQLTPLRRAMRGTNPPQRCVALQGELGQCVGCSIYEQRPTPCREFEMWEPDGSVNPRCNEARAGIGLPPLAARTVAGSTA
ncbi:MAG: YkgJ family cysteine cluster protein [Moraxellaceae bacterium]|nr:YkgJ family cysteine cluster protein [Moraxellaceae bacterium]